MQHYNYQRNINWLASKAGKAYIAKKVHEAIFGPPEPEEYVPVYLGASKFHGMTFEIPSIEEIERRIRNK